MRKRFSGNNLSLGLDAPVQPRQEIEWHPNELDDFRRARQQIVNHLAQFEEHRLACELREIQRQFKLNGRIWLDHFFQEVGRARGKYLAAELSNQFWEFMNTGKMATPAAQKR